MGRYGTHPGKHNYCIVCKQQVSTPHFKFNKDLRTLPDENTNPPGHGEPQ